MSAKPNKYDETNHGLCSVLSHPVLYLLFGRLMGLSEKYQMYINRFIKPFPGMSLLDIGCGPAAILNFLPPDVDYTGYDINFSYIAYAKKKYGHRAAFYNQRVSGMTLADSMPFDVVLADGLLHHLSEMEAKDLFRIGRMVLKPDGFMLTIDPAFVENQNPLDRWITETDRGRHVRYPEEYKKMAESCFSVVEAHVIKKVGTFSLTGCILKCCKE
jgi:SAM-dependent methyltransferase